MSGKTNIAWCDSTVNFWSGCTKVSEGCKFCYAEARDARMLTEKIIHWGKGTPRLKGIGAVKTALALNRKPWICDGCGEAFKTQALHDAVREFNPDRTAKSYIHRYAENPGWHRRRIFSLSLGDWLDAEVPIEWFAEMLDTIRQCDQVTWILCTKRPERFWGKEGPRYFIGRLEQAQNHTMQTRQDELFQWLCLWGNGHPPKNIIILTSVENQQQADIRIPELLKIPAACRGLSVEPMLGPINFEAVPVGMFGPLRPLRPHQTEVSKLTPKIDWVIFGGESGKDARPCNVDWIRDGVKQCQAAGVTAFVKQLGARPFLSGVSGLGSPDGNQYVHKFPINDPKGGNMFEWPEDLRVREFPQI